LNSWPFNTAPSSRVFAVAVLAMEKAAVAAAVA